MTRPRVDGLIYLLTTPIPHIVGAWRRVTNRRKQ